MALKIRLARGGAKKRPFYRIVVAEASAPRDGRYVERVGTYNPMVPKEHEQRMTLNSERITFWLGKGAKPTDRVHKMLAAAGLAEPLVIRDQPKKSAPGKKRAEREAEAAEAEAILDGNLGFQCIVLWSSSVGYIVRSSRRRGRLGQVWTRLDCRSRRTRHSFRMSWLWQIYPRRTRWTSRYFR